MPDPREIPLHAAPERNPKPPAPPAERKEFRHPAELAPEEKERVLRELDSPRFADKSVAQAYTILLDEGCYLCSQASMHRLLRGRGTSGERRAHASHPARKKPELLAAGPNEIWSWDITKLKGPARGIWYLLYVIMDIYSRKVVHWEIWPTETGILAREFIEHAISSNGGIKPKAVHADRGTSMTSNTVAGLYAKLNIVQSHSRPHVSNDNPYSESAFKTLKYCPAFPGQFGSIQDANLFCEAFFTYYNTEHRHSGIAMHTPSSVHDGSWAQVQAAAPPPSGPPTRPTPNGSAATARSPGPAGQGLDQRTAGHHRDQQLTTNYASSLMSHSV